ncbi:PadR family transcriptional regulator [Kitasatospora sp. NPDC004289]
MKELDLPLAEWIVLALMAEGPSHGFAIATLTAEGAEIGEFWYVSRPMVYRSITRLVDRGLITPVGAEDGNRGPQRMVYAATRAAKSTVTRWLGEPVTELFDVRADLTCKLLLLQRRDASPVRLIERQRVVIDEIEESLRAKEEAAGDQLAGAIYAWRLEHVRAASRFLDTVEAASAKAVARTA